MPTDFDHVALAVPEVQPHLDAVVAELGAVVLGGGTQLGFRAMQVQLGRMSVELIQPHATDHNDFMHRFLQRHGPGPHHLTFKVDDLAGEIERLRGLGLEPVQIDLSNDWWKECFLTPDVAHGTVVQLAESTIDVPEVVIEGEPPPWGFKWWRDPPSLAAAPVALLHVVIGSPDPPATVSFFADVLGGSPNGGILTWPGGGRIAVEPRDGKPGVDRLVVDSGPERTIAGTRFAAS